MKTLVSPTPTSGRQMELMQQYYRRQAAVYDATRWMFLHGRNEIVRRLELPPMAEQTLLEVGCGTGRNLARLAQQHPGLHITGIDVSPEMLARASRKTARYSRRVRLFNAPYAPNAFSLSGQVDTVLFSYSLTMFNPGWEAALDRAFADLQTGGLVAVVDFHDTQSRVFRAWMTRHCVRVDGHLLPALQARFRTEYLSVRSGGLGLWQYFLFVGRKV